MAEDINNDINIVVISGGTATNELVPLFKSLCKQTTFILPVSDNGGSTSELLRVIGGPAIGDIRSRLTRLIPESHEPLRKLLSFRLSSDPERAKMEWNQIVEGRHYLWEDIQSSTREILRAFFVHVHVELLKRSRHQFSAHTQRQFRYELASVGNLFLTGVRLFIGSLDSAIELFARLTEIDARTLVIPCINTNFSYHISALLENDLIVTGQSQISHPSTNPSVEIYPPPITRTRPPTPTNSVYGTDYFNAKEPMQKLSLNVPINDVATTNHLQGRDMHGFESEDSDEEESGSVPQYTHPELKKSQLHFSKTEEILPLLSPVKRIFYISPYGEEICPVAYNRATHSLANSDVIVFSIGSLMTSVIPVIILKGVGRAIAAELANPLRRRKKRILLLNGCSDRETHGMTAVDFLRVIVESAIYSIRESKTKSTFDIHETNPSRCWKRFITHLFFMKDPKIAVDMEYIEREKEIKCIEVQRMGNKDYYDLNDLSNKLGMVIRE